MPLQRSRRLSEQALQSLQVNEDTPHFTSGVIFALIFAESYTEGIRLQRSFDSKMQNYRFIPPLNLYRADDSPTGKAFNTDAKYLHDQYYGSHCNIRGLVRSQYPSQKKQHFIYYVRRVRHLRR